MGGVRGAGCRVRREERWISSSTSSWRTDREEGHTASRKPLTGQERERAVPWVARMAGCRRDGRRTVQRLVRQSTDATQREKMR